MKHVRKYLPILLVLLLALGMASCGSSGGDTGDAGAASSSSASADTSADTSADAGTDSAESVEYEHGTIDGTVYTNDFFGFTFSVKDDWTFTDEKGLRELNQSVSDLLDNDSITNALKEGQTFIDMQASSGDDSFSSINLTVSYAPGSSGIGDITDATTEYMKSMYENAGFENIEISKETAAVSGGTLDTLVTKMTVEGIDVVEKQFFFTNGDYLGTLTVSGMSEEECDELLSWITLK